MKHATNYPIKEGNMTTRFGSLTKVGPATYKDNANLVTVTATVAENNIDLPFTVNDVAQPIVSKRTITIQVDACLEDGRQLPILQLGVKYKAITSELVGGNAIIVSNPPITYPGANGEKVAFTKTDIIDTVSSALNLILTDFGA